MDSFVKNEFIGIGGPSDLVLHNVFASLAMFHLSTLVEILNRWEKPEKKM